MRHSFNASPDVRQGGTTYGFSKSPSSTGRLCLTSLTVNTNFRFGPQDFLLGSPQVHHGPVFTSPRGKIDCIVSTISSTVVRSPLVKENIRA